MTGYRLAAQVWAFSSPVGAYLFTISSQYLPRGFWPVTRGHQQGKIRSNIISCWCFSSNLFSQLASHNRLPRQWFREGKRFSLMFGGVSVPLFECNVLPIYQR